MMLGVFLLTPPPAFSMDTLTDTQMADINGRAGVSLGAGEDFNFARITFSAAFWGDPDGHHWRWSGSGTSNVTGYDNQMGYLIISGDGTKGILGLGVDKGGVLTLDSGRTGSGGATMNQVNIPANTTFMQFMADAPPELGLKLNIDTQGGKAILGMDDDDDATVSHQLGKISVGDLYMGAVADSNSASNEVKMWVWIE